MHIENEVVTKVNKIKYAVKLIVSKALHLKVICFNEVKSQVLPEYCSSLKVITIRKWSYVSVDSLIR